MLDVQDWKGEKKKFSRAIQMRPKRYKAVENK